jgi:phosphinothricin acetyltransferase
MPSADTRVRIRAAEEADLPALTAIYNHYVTTTPITFDLEPLTVGQRRPWFDAHPATGPHRLLVAEDPEDAGTILGYATSGQFRSKPAYLPSVETSIYCSPGAVGRGVGTRLYDALFAELATEDVHRAYAGIALPNEPSRRLHERFGFEPVGTFREVGRKFGRYWDVLWLERPMGVA